MSQLFAPGDRVILLLETTWHEGLIASGPCQIADLNRRSYLVILEYYPATYEADFARIVLDDREPE